MNEIPKSFVSQLTPLSEDIVTKPEDKQLLRELNGKGFEIQIGLTAELSDQVTKLSLEPGIKEYCPNDSGRRFTNREATEAWLSKGRVMFLLMIRNEQNTLDLAGYGWVGPQTSDHVKEGAFTFAIRIGSAGQGQGLATPYARLMIAAAAEKYGAKDIWLETWQSNQAAVHVYHKVGFIDVDQMSDERAVSGGTVPDVRLYMLLPNEQLPVIKSA